MSALTATDRLFLTIREFCAACGISRATLYRAVKAGTGPRITKIGGRTLIRAETAREWAEAQEASSANVALKPRGRAGFPTFAELLGARR